MEAIQTTNDLRNYLNQSIQQIDNKSYIEFSSSLLAEAGELVSFLQINSLRIYNAQSNAFIGPINDNQFLITGQSNTLGVDQSAILTASVSTEGKILFSLKLSPQKEDWTFRDSFSDLPTYIGVNGSFVEDKESFFYNLSIVQPAFVLANFDDTVSGIKKGLNFQGQWTLTSPFEVLMTMLGSASSTPLSLTGTIDLSSSIPDIQFSAPISSFSLSLSNQSITNFSVELKTQYSSDTEEDDESIASLKGDILISDSSTPIRISTPVLESDVVWDFGASLPENQFSLQHGFQGLASLAGVGTSEFHMPSAIQQFSNFYLSEVVVGISPSNKSIQQLSFIVKTSEVWNTPIQGMNINDIEVSWTFLLPSGGSSSHIHGYVLGNVNLGESPNGFSLTIKSQIPDFDIQAKLNENDTISLDQAINYFFGSNVQLQHHLAIDHLSLLAAPNQSNFRVIAEIVDDWPILPGLILSPISFEINRQSGQTTGELNAQFSLGTSSPTRFFISASHNNPDNGWDFSGGNIDNKELSLRTIFSEFIPTFGAPQPDPSIIPNIQLSNLDVAFNTKTKNFHFSGQTSAPITIPFLKSDHASKTVTATVKLDYVLDDKTKKHVLTGLITAQILISGSTFDVSYEIGKDTHDFNAAWTAAEGESLLDFRHLPDALGITGFGTEGGAHMPASADLDLSLKSVKFQYQSASDTFLLEATSNKYGTAFFVASREVSAVGEAKDVSSPDWSTNTEMTGNEAWHYAFGLQFDSTGNNSPQSTGDDAKAMGNFSSVASHFQLQEFHFAVASADFSKFTVPDVHTLPLPQKGGGASASANSSASPAIPPKIQAGTSLKLYKGFSVFGVMDFATGSGAVKNLGKITGGGELIVAAGYKADTQSAYLSALLEGAMSVPSGKSSRLAIQNPSLEIDLGATPLFRISSEMDVMIDHQKETVNASLTITDAEIEIGANATFSPAMHGPKGLSGLFLDDAGVEIGINFIPPGFNFGLQGHSHVGTLPDKTAADSKAADFAMVLEIVEAVPNPELVSFYLSELDIPTIHQLFVGGSSDISGMPSFIRDFKVTDLAFCWADTVVTLPDGSVVQPGFRFNGNLDFVSGNNPMQFPDVQIHADLEVHPNSGIKGMIEMSPMHIGHVLDITGKGRGVYLEKKGGKRVQKQISPKQDTQTLATGDVTRVEVVAPGGPVLQFNTAHSPYLNASLDIALFKSLHFEVEAEVSDSGFSFDLEVEVSDIAKAVIQATFDKTKGFHGHSDFGMHLKADLGPLVIEGIDLGTLHLDTGFDLNMTLDINKTNFSCVLKGEFDFEGLHLKLPTLTIDVPFGSFKDIPEKLIQHIEANLSTIFEDLVNFGKEAFDEAKKEVGKIEKAVEDDAKIILNDAKAEVKDIEAKGKAALQDLTKAADAVAQEATDIENQAQTVLSDAATKVSQIVTDADKEVQAIGDEIDQIGKAAAHELTVIADKIKDELAEIDAAINQTLAAAKAEARRILAAVDEEVKNILAVAQKTFDTIIQDAQKVVSSLEHQAKELLDKAADLAKKAEEALKHAAKKIVNVGKKIIHKLWPW
ncbi:MAG: hypothetical protein AAF587_37040 [Bacteroidota bacterium]